MSDIILAAFIVLAVLYGYRIGTINVVARIGALIIGYWAARSFSAVVAQALVKALPQLTTGGESSEKLLSFLSLFIDTDGAANRLIEIVMFIVIFIIVCWLVKKIAYMLTGIFGHGLLGRINRVLGALVALILALLLILIVTDIVFPAFVGLGFGQPLLDFMDKSTIVLPIVRYFQYLV